MYSPTTWAPKQRMAEYRAAHHSSREQSHNMSVEMDDHERKIVNEFCHYLEKSKQLFNGLRCIAKMTRAKGRISKACQKIGRKKREIIRHSYRPDGSVRHIKLTVPLLSVSLNTAHNGVPALGSQYVEPQETHPQPQESEERQYSERKDKRSTNWDKAFPGLKKCFMETRACLTDICCRCNKKFENILFCSDCGPAAYFCKECFLRTHDIAPLHLPQIWLGYEFIPFPWKQQMWLAGHVCDSPTPSRISVIDNYGRLHTIEIAFCRCFSKAEMLVRLGLWPSTPCKPQTALTIKFMDLGRHLLLEGSLATYKFASVMESFVYDIPHYQEKNVHDSLSNDCATMFRRLMYEQKLHLCASSLTECPICQKTHDRLPSIISMDGCFRLLRKKTSGYSSHEPYHNDYILSDADVTPNLRPTVVAHEKIDCCSDFKATDPKRSMFQNENLDIMGMFGSLCIHDVPLYFIKMRSGEKLGYAVSVIQATKAKRNNAKFVYDVNCKMTPQLKQAKLDVPTTDLGIGLFHIWAHGMICQNDYSPRLKEGFRMADGENCERLWSILGQFSTILKEMTDANFHDLLCEVLLHVSEKSLAGIAGKLVDRLESAKELEIDQKKALEEIVKPLRAHGHDVSHAAIDGWNTEWKARYIANKKTIDFPLEVQYALLLNKLYTFRPRLPLVPGAPDDVDAEEEVERLETEVYDMEEKLDITERWTPNSVQLTINLQKARIASCKDLLSKMHQEAVDRRHYIQMKKTAGGYKAAAKHSKQIKKTNTKLMGLLKQFNGLNPTNAQTFDDIKDPESQAFNFLPPINGIPFYTIQEAVMALNLIRRANEEIHAIGIELPALYEHYREQHSIYKDRLLGLGQPDSLYVTGSYAALFSLLVSTEEIESEIYNAVLGAYDVPLADKPHTEFVDVHREAEIKVLGDEPDVEWVVDNNHIDGVNTDSEKLGCDALWQYGDQEHPSDNEFDSDIEDFEYVVI